VANLTALEPNSSKLAQAGAPQALVQQLGSASFDVCEAAVAAAARLLITYASARATLADEDGVPPLVQLILSYSKPVQKKGDRGRLRAS
jgi:hypothetical protein